MEDAVAHSQIQTAGRKTRKNSSPAAPAVAGAFAPYAVFAISFLFAGAFVLGFVH